MKHWKRLEPRPLTEGQRDLVEQMTKVARLLADKIKVDECEISRLEKHIESQKNVLAQIESP
jgi:uncharacterized protein YicC (UPF0701 family)